MPPRAASASRPTRPAEALMTFPGLAHRMETVGDDRQGAVRQRQQGHQRRRRAPGPVAAIRRVYWIAGGQPKTGGIDDLADLFPRVIKAYLIGEAAPTPSPRRSRARPRRVQCGTIAAARRSRLRRRRGQRAGTRSSCCRRPARPSTSSPTSRRAARRSAPLSRPSRPAAQPGGPHDDRQQRRTPSRAPTARRSGVWWWTVDRWMLGRGRRADRHRRGACPSPPARPRRRG